MKMRIDPKQSLDIFRLLYSSGRRNPTVLALIGSEMHFRRTAERLIEYFAWLLFELFSQDLAGRLTLGIAQIRVSSWRTYQNENLSSGIFDLFVLMIDPYHNYDCCERILEKEFKESSTLDRVLRIYNGRPRKYYRLVFHRYYDFFSRERWPSSASK